MTIFGILHHPRMRRDGLRLFLEPPEQLHPVFVLGQQCAPLREVEHGFKGEFDVGDRCASLCREF
jgi:hypothetical protein